MPYGRKLYRKRPMRATRRRRPTVKKLVSDVRMLKSAVEKNFLDTDLSSAVTSSTGSVTSICTIPQGDGEGNRTGYSVLVKKIEFIGTLVQDATATNTQTRILLGRSPKQVAIPSSINASSAGPLNTANPVALTRQDATATGKRNVLLMDRLVVTDDAKGQSVSFRWSKTYKHGIKIIWDTDDTDGTSFQDNPFWFGIVSNEATNTPDFNGFVRLWYMDA